MLQAISDRISGLVGGTIIVLLTLPFALWGISSYFKGGKIEGAATVNGDKISMQQVEDAVFREKQELRRRFGDKLPFTDEMIKKEAVSLLVNNKVLDLYTAKNGFRVSDFQLYANIKSMYSEDGKFSEAVFDQDVRNQGYTVPQYESLLRGQIRASQFEHGMRSTAIVTKAEVEQYVKLRMQKREVSLLKFDIAADLPKVKVTDADIKNAYDSQPKGFMTPEKVSIDYIELTDAHFTKGMKIDEQKIQQAYKNYVAQVAQKEERKASHILISLKPNRAAAMAKIKKIQKLLAEGKSFASLAKKYSDDTGSAAKGGELGWIDRGEMVKPFENALYKLKKSGDVSGVVETKFGLHLIKLEGVRAEKPLPLSSKRASIIAKLKHDAASDVFYDASEKLANVSYENPDSLAATAKALGISVKTSDLMTRDSGTGIGANPKIRKAAFSSQVLSDGLNSDVIELGPDDDVVLRVHDHVPASKLPLAKVRDSIEKQLQHEKAQAMAVKKAKAVKEQILSGKPASGFVSRSISLGKPMLLSRTDFSKLNQDALKLVFSMDKPAAGKVTAAETVLDNNDVAVIILHKVVDPDFNKVDITLRNEMKEHLEAQYKKYEYYAAFNEVKAGFKIKTNSKAFESSSN